MSGAWIFVCGPSGAGKDSVIAWTQLHLASCKNIVFARRMVTRPAQPGSDHDPITEHDFLGLLEGGHLRWHWRAHGFGYGIAQAYAADVKAGRKVVVNASRAHVLMLSPSPDLQVVHITSHPKELAARLLKRGRDSANAITDRLKRNTLYRDVKADCVIVNDTALASAGQRLADFLNDGE